MPGYAKSPNHQILNTKNLTPAELSDSINSLNSLCSRIRIVPRLELEENLNSLLGRHAKIFPSIGGLGFLMAAKFLRQLDPNSLF